ncbi:MAG: hypothetical protein QGI93_00075 [Planctomycetota bacterium]|jgi:hypothetical protein|nr:hypothetical protein [Planctomycetota bacterium]MDP6937899.1 hypothetical protein [Planctomycetota bacterium]
MARSSKKRGSRGSSKARKEKKAAPAAEVEVVEEGKGMGMEDGMVIVTTVILIATCLMVDYHLASYFEDGTFF